MDNSEFSQRSVELDFPERLPMGPRSKQSHAMADEDIKSVESFKEEQSGRMNRHSWLKSGHIPNLLSTYTTPRSLRVTYAMVAKRKKDNE